MTALLTADEAARLTRGVNVIVRPGDPDHLNHLLDMTALFVAPQDWVALTGPCPTCDGGGLVRWLADDALAVERIIGMNCLNCRDGRRIVPLYRECPDGLKSPGSPGGWLPPSDYHDETCTCEGERRVLVGRGSIEVVPVTTEFLGDQPRAYLDSHGLWLLNVGNLPPAHGPIIKRKDLDPLPVPGDFGIVIDCVELA